MGMNLTLDGDELIMPTCGHKNKDGSIILCEECVNKIKLLQALLKQTQDILDEIEKLEKKEKSIWISSEELKSKIIGKKEKEK